MKNTIKITTVLGQTIALIKASIANDEWGAYLPPERKLCDELNISRSTLRRALSSLTEQGFIAEGRSGKRRRITMRGKAPSLDVESSTKRVLWISKQSFPAIGNISLNLFTSLQNSLPTVNAKLESIKIPHLLIKDSSEGFQDWLDEHPADCYLLHHLPVDVHKQFASREIKAIVLGTSDDKLLPSIDIDAAAATQHAVSILQQHGHRNICLLRRADNLLGELKVEQTFRTTCKESDIQADVLLCNEDPFLMREGMQHYFTQSSATALIATQPEIALQALSWLQEAGINVPKQHSIILLRSERLLNYHSPRISHYTVNESTVARLVFRLTIKVLDSEMLAKQEKLIVPTYVAGESVAPPVF